MQHTSMLLFRGGRETQKRLKLYVAAVDFWEDLAEHASFSLALQR